MIDIFDKIRMHSLIERSSFEKEYSGLVMVQSTRFGGVSTGPYESLNLGLSTGDDKGSVTENRTRLWQLIGTTEDKVAGGSQVHGDEIKVVSTPGYFEGYDAFITNIPGIFLTVTIADCVPILVFDPVQKAIAAIHAGWRGTEAAIAEKTIGRLSEQYNSRPEDCVAYIGASIGFDAFEVGEEVAEKFEEDLKKASSSSGKYLVDLKSANRRQLLQAGMSATAIEVSPFCTVTDHERFFSYRKEGGVTGRMLAVVGMREKL